MLDKEFLDDQPLFAVLHGRVLPIDELESFRDIDSQSVSSMSGQTHTIATAVEHSIEFKTRRNPELITHPLSECGVYIVSMSDRRYFSPVGARAGVDGTDGGRTVYWVELSILDSS